MYVSITFSLISLKKKLKGNSTSFYSLSHVFYGCWCRVYSCWGLLVENLSKLSMEVIAEGERSRWMLNSPIFSPLYSSFWNSVCRWVKLDLLWLPQSAVIIAAYCHFFSFLMTQPAHASSYFYCLLAAISYVFASKVIKVSNTSPDTTFLCRTPLQPVPLYLCLNKVHEVIYCTLLEFEKT